MKVVLTCLILLVVQSFGQEFKWKKVKVDGVDYDFHRAVGVILWFQWAGDQRC